MVYLILLFFCTTYMYGVHRYKVGYLVLFPPFLFYFLVSALQYNVGSDYPSYIYIYENPWVLDKYFNSGEYFFYYSNIFLNYFEFHPQSIFFVFSLFQSVFIFLFFHALNKRGAVLWIFVFIFFVVSNILQNQMNGIRQYAALTFFPLISMYVFDRRYIKAVFSIIISMMFHSSAVVFFVLIFLRLFLDLKEKSYFYVFILSIPFYFLVSKYTLNVLEYFDLRFLSYVESDYFVAGDYVTLLTKIYYLPAIFIFFYLFCSGENKCFVGCNDYFKFAILIFSCSYWSFLMSLDIAILSRVSSYFWFFVIFPLYFVAVYLSRRSSELLAIYLLYLFAPYASKVTFLAKNEFLYKSIIFN
ncbi:hypothetical protein A33_020290 [Vibrio cholerae AM-19226]|uniref:EpsG family protein n=1 Tax=Vibrio cholerae TaxID=666 RepID=UPI000157DB00|nr:EpsG family protein [Vibrio cholerae]KNA52640.1 hypothetical protein A33_020290 [Vibrio cholerae AM-19226]